MAVPPLVALKVSAAQCVGERYRLVKTQTKSFSRDSVHTPGSVSYQCDIPAVDLLQAARHGYSASLQGAWLRIKQMASQLGKLLPGILKPHARIARNQGDASLVVAERCDIHLCPSAPMNFHAIGPHFPATVLPLRKPFFSPRVT